MAGRHLRRRRGDRVRRILPHAGVALCGVMLGVAWSVVTTPVLDSDAIETAVVDTVPVAATEVVGTPELGDASMVPRRRPITLAFGGDVHAQGVLARRLEDDVEDFVGPFASILRRADLAMVNVETAITTRGTPVGKTFTFRAPPALFDGLAAAGVDVVTMANNHGLDYGPVGLADTLTARATAPVRAVGIGDDEDDAYAPALLDVGGWRVAVIGATQVLDGDLIRTWTAGPEQPGLASAKRVDRLVEEVRLARDSADTVVVYLHWGIETHECPSSVQQELAGLLADAGADVIVGTHAHRLQGGGRLGDAVVHYGLGNFLFGAPSEPSRQTGVFVVDVAGRDVLGYEWHPGRIVASVPQPLTGAPASDALDDWESRRACTGLER